MSRVHWLFLSVLTVSTAYSSVIAFDVPTGAGNQAYTGSLGLDFVVNSPIEVTALGVFDSDQDGLHTQVTVAIYDRGTQSAITPFVTFSGTEGTLVNGSRFKIFEVPIVLTVGAYSVVAWGYSDAERNGNLGCNTVAACLGGSTPVVTAASTMNTGGGLISFENGGRYAPGTGFPTGSDAGPENRYSAGTFEFQAVPEPGTFALLGATLAAIGIVRRRR